MIKSSSSKERLGPLELVLELQLGLHIIDFYGDVFYSIPIFPTTGITDFYTINSKLPPASLPSSLPSKSSPCQHEPPITKTTTTSLPSKSPPCQGPQPELGALEGHSGTNHMLWCTLPTENRIALQFLLKSHIFLPYLAVGMVRESTIDAAIINLSHNKSTKEEKEDGEATHSQENRGYWLPEF